MNTVREQVRSAYADCQTGIAAMATRNLHFRADESVTPEEARAIAQEAIPDGYNAFRAKLKQNGFRWAPSQGAWSAHHNHQTVTLAERIAAARKRQSLTDSRSAAVRGTQTPQKRKETTRCESIGVPRRSRRPANGLRTPTPAVRDLDGGRIEERPVPATCPRLRTGTCRETRTRKG